VKRKEAAALSLAGTGLRDVEWKNRAAARTVQIANESEETSLTHTKRERESKEYTSRDETRTNDDDTACMRRQQARYDEKDERERNGAPSAAY
jgi:hypothetical protein